MSGSVAAFGEEAVLLVGEVEDFGAFDVIYNQKKNQAFVLECNTAPGIEGTTLDNYVEAINGARA